MVMLKLQIALSLTLCLMAVTMVADSKRLKTTARSRNGFTVTRKAATSTTPKPGNTRKAATSTTPKPENFKPKDCHDWRKAGARQSGVYVIYPNGTYAVKVHCEHGVKTSFTVIQRRIDGKINFHTTWYYYKMGFGSAQGDYWAGLDNIHHLTTSGNNKLQIDLQDWSGNRRQARYSHFLVLDERNLYQMYVSGYSGNLPVDDLAHNNGMYFATPDRPDKYNCAVNQRAGWWFNYCSYTLPNGIFYYGGQYAPTTGFYDGIYWRDWLGYGYSLRFISLSLYR